MQIVAHRGNASAHPENTVGSVESACMLGVKYVEIDVQFSADYVPFVIHDADLIRTHDNTDVVAETSSEKLIKLGVPTLQDIVVVLTKYPGVTLFVEIKSESYDVLVGTNANVPHVLLEEIGSIMNRADVTTEFVVIAFDRDVVKLWQNMYPWYASGWVLSDYSKDTLDKLVQLRPNYAFIDYIDIPADVTVNDKITTWCAYEVTSRDVGDRLIQQGVELLETMQVSNMLSEYGLLAQR